MSDEAKTAAAAPPEAPPIASAPPSPAPARRSTSFLVRLVLMGVVPAVLAAGGLYYYVVGGRYVSTENAYIKADKIVVSTDVSERVVHVAVDENDIVKEGQLLFRLDDEPFRIAVAQARARIADSIQVIEGLRAEYQQKVAELDIAQNDVSFYGREFKRQEMLSTKGFASQSKFDKAERDLLTSRKRIVAIRQEIARVRAGLGGNPKAPATQSPQVMEAMSRLDEVALDLHRTEIRAPGPGIITNFELQVGEYIEEGDPVFSVVSMGPVWIEANLRETDLTNVRVGQTATIRVDAYPDRAWTAAVGSISPATGAEFAVLPPQNASGNWVKVIQRIPVRLQLTNRPDGPTLRAGMSVRVEIDTGHERTLPGIIASALGWVKAKQ
jgi:membrane fusion protein (multidrug efflux system)